MMTVAPPMQNMPAMSAPSGAVGAVVSAPSSSATAAAVGSSASPDVEMVDASASVNLAVGAAASTIEWSIIDSLILASLVEQALKGRQMTADAILVQQLVDWSAIATALQSRSASHASLGTFNGDACANRFTTLLLNITSRSPPLPPITLVELQAPLKSLLTKLQQDRLAELENGHALATAKIAKLEAAKNEAVAALTAQQEQQAQAQAAAAAARAAAAAAAQAPMQPVASINTGTMSVKMEPLSSGGGGAPRPSQLLPIPDHPMTGSGGGRPSPLTVQSPSMSASSNSMAQIAWANSSLHTPLKAMSQVNLSRQQSATSGLQTPAMSRQQSLDAPGTPHSHTPAFPSMTPAKFAEICNAIMDILTARQEAEIFLVPVDPADAAGYYDVIKTPMSFQDIREKVESGEISQPMHFWYAVQQIYTNCYTYNDKKTPFYKQARTLETQTLDLFRKNFPAGGTAVWEAKKQSANRPPSYKPPSQVVPQTPSQIQQPNFAAAMNYPMTPMQQLPPQQQQQQPQMTPISPSSAQQTQAPQQQQPPQQPSFLAPPPSAAAAVSSSSSNAPSPIPVTPTRKPTVAPPSSGTSLDESVSLAQAASNELPRNTPRRQSVHSVKKEDQPPAAAAPTAPDTPSAPMVDVDEDAAPGATSATGGEEEEVGSIHDALTPARNQSRNKRGASAMSTPAPATAAAAATPVATSTTAATSTPSTSRKSGGRNKQAPATPSNTAAASSNAPLTPAPSTTPDAEMDESNNTTDKSKRRGRPPRKTPAA